MTEPTPPIEQHPPTSTSSTGTNTNPPTTTTATTTTNLPRITIRYCTQCKWMLRAAYFAQELLSTFSTSLGEVALVPCTGGTFIVSITSASASETGVRESVLWDRRVDGGFPEVKVLKSRVRNVVDPQRDLGHTDRALRQESGGNQRGSQEKEKDKCEDCQA
ncbi:selenoprotein domain protein [Aspergillus udagawae]|uniref:Selenoprotein domain protein n=1 Tax=Aspergillus udagawae TaxID=91492 RepID=A0ABQ1B3V2_9EURO|nr:selenoprotein domain protein [Aspergillus udagawae]GFF93260.1 selenoprotein domain protein [Aspergillus udagawae]GFG07654.1 selenoprotein domain protein [Aspergillus udagawae]GFG24387.1 selenoprotein domain protein [Aspergillus udagawae]